MPASVIYLSVVKPSGTAEGGKNSSLSVSYTALITQEGFAAKISSSLICILHKPITDDHETAESFEGFR